MEEQLITSPGADGIELDGSAEITVVSFEELFEFDLYPKAIRNSMIGDKK